MGDVASFVGALAFVGLGAAVIDQVQGIEGRMGLSAASSPLYYLGWVLLVTGLVLFFVTIDSIHFHPIWLFVVALLGEVYGWWNVWWSLIDLFVCGGCNAPAGPGVDLGNFGPLGTLYIPLWLFILTTVVAVSGPILIALVAPRDIEVTSGNTTPEPGESPERGGAAHAHGGSKEVR